MNKAEILQVVRNRRTMAVEGIKQHAKDRVIKAEFVGREAELGVIEMLLACQCEKGVLRAIGRDNEEIVLDCSICKS